MKANNKESQIFSDAIDAINNGMEDIINIYNTLEEDQPLIQFDDAVVQQIEKVKQKYGNEFVDKKINTVVKEMLDWLPLEDTEDEER
ncbi:hypothetical protein JOD43_003637 [Pullulanibacillus pueri]|uniref:Atypical membrane-integrating protein (Mistic protein) n=1 Tax=Pullulanibacillus pueri TaxID=1437324 RepID=A0A8J3ENS6_9BACL|nr:atypical membrane-integrating protein (Mistic protein) [Pullulanibacillus pueri]MBM7683457.1 hypothetical protein [Pullulanibacillus pueri]GGH87459.1 hypothetical protein GCM10007096_37530 [Pullulanibacillus pueri]